MKGISFKLKIVWNTGVSVVQYSYNYKLLPESKAVWKEGRPNNDIFCEILLKIKVKLVFHNYI